MQYAGTQYTDAGYNGQQQAYGYGQQYYQQQQQQPPQPIQHQYSGQQQQYASTPYTGNVPFPQPSPYHAPSTLQPTTSQQPAHRPPRTQTPHPTVSSRRRVSSSNTKKPIRSALKDPDRSRVTSGNGPLLSVPTATATARTRRQSGGPELRPRMNSISRTRTNSSSRTDPGARSAFP
jgi:hypothetical protein